MKAVLLAGLLLIPNVDDPVRVSVACRGSEPVAIRVEMDRPGAVEIPAQVLTLACDSDA